LRGSLENLDGQLQKSRRKEKDGEKKVIRVKIYVHSGHTH
jgi:hypothetical protein